MLAPLTTTHKLRMNLIYHLEIWDMCIFLAACRLLGSHCWGYA